MRPSLLSLSQREQRLLLEGKKRDKRGSEFSILKNMLCANRLSLLSDPSPGPVSVSGCSVIGEGGDDVLIWRRRLIFSR